MLPSIGARQDFNFRNDYMKNLNKTLVNDSERLNKLKKIKKEFTKVYERNSNTGTIRWRYVNELPCKFGWPNYGRLKNNCMDKKDNNSI
jgi:hypothetical protein